MEPQRPAEQDPKDLAFYAASVEAWYSTRFERDKSLLTLAGGGIGLLITLLSTVGIRSRESLVLYVLALFSFAVCLGAVLWIFHRNSDHIEEIIADGKTTEDRWLTVLDCVAVLTFLFAVVLASVISISAAFHSFETQEKSMSTQEDKKIMANDSINGVARLRTSQPDTSGRSVNGAAKLKPTESNTAQSQASRPQTSPQPATNQTPSSSKGK